MKTSAQNYRVKLDSRSYDIHIQAGCLSQIGEQLTSLFVKASRCLVVSNDVVAPLYLQQVESSMSDAGWLVETHILPDGEKNKNGGSA